MKIDKFLNIDDRNLYYGKTYVSYLSAPFRIEKFRSKCKIEGNIILKDGRYDEKIVVNDSSVDFAFPSSQNVNGSVGHVFYLSRVLLKQYKKGINNNNSQVITCTLFNPPLKRARRYDEVLTFFDIFTQKEYPQFQEALNTILKGERTSTAFTEKFSVAIHPYKDDPVCLYKQHPIGIIRDDKVIIHKDAVHLNEELQQFVQVEVV